MRKNVNYWFFYILKLNEEWSRIRSLIRNRIRIHKSEVRIRGSGSGSDQDVTDPQHCFPAIRRKNSAAEKKIRLSWILTFRRHLYLCAWQKYKISLICLELTRIRGGKQTSNMFRPFLALLKLVYIRPQICPSALLFIRQLATHCRDRRFV